jgi:dihydrofolate reductase
VLGDGVSDRRYGGWSWCRVGEIPTLVGMGKLIYSPIMSLDGYIADTTGNFDWATPDEELHAFVNDMERPIGTYLYGRRMYETMAYWETAPDGAEQPPLYRDYAQIWRAADKIVFSRTLEEPISARTRIERDLDVEGIRRLKGASERDLSVGGANLAGQALRAGLVDELRVFLVPVIVGGGTPFLPGGVRASLELLDERRFAGGAVYGRYRVT